MFLDVLFLSSFEPFYEPLYLYRSTLVGEELITQLVFWFSQFSPTDIFTVEDSEWYQLNAC